METPNNLEAEQHVLAGIASNFINPALVNYEDFYDPSHKLILKALYKLRSILPVNSVQVWKELEKIGINAQAGGETYIIDVLDRIVISDTNAEYWLKELKEASNKRKLISYFKHGLEDLTKNKVNSDDALAKLKKITSEIENHENRTGLNLLTPKDIFSVDYEKIKSLWGILLFPSSIVQLNSEPGLGKTTLMYNLLIHGALNKDFLNLSFQKELTFLYVDLETPPWARKKKFEAICDTEIPVNFYFLETLNIHKQESNLIQDINENGIDVVILDTQSRVFQQEDENNNAEANAVLSKLRFICNETGVCIILVHHLGKDTGGKGVYSGRGASAVAGGVDIVLNLSSLDEDVLKLEVVKNRLNNDYFVMGIKKIGYDRFEPYEINDPKSLTLKTTVQDEILKLPEDIYKTSEIQSKLQLMGHTEPTIRRALSGLVQANKVKRIKHGEYEIPGNVLDLEDKDNFKVITDYDLDNNTIPI